MTRATDTDLHSKSNPPKSQILRQVQAYRLCLTRNEVTSKRRISIFHNAFSRHRPYHQQLPLASQHQGKHPKLHKTPTNHLRRENCGFQRLKPQQRNTDRTLPLHVPEKQIKRNSRQQQREQPATSTPIRNHSAVTSLRTKRVQPREARTEARIKTTRPLELILQYKSQQRQP